MLPDFSPFKVMGGWHTWECVSVEYFSDALWSNIKYRCQDRSDWALLHLWQGGAKEGEIQSQTQGDHKRKGMKMSRSIHASLPKGAFSHIAHLRMFEQHIFKNNLFLLLP